MVSYATPSFVGHSLWLCPSPNSDLFTNLIQEIATACKTPVFPPHVTLLAGASLPEGQLLDRCRGLAAKLQPATLKVTEVASKDLYFQCVFALLAKDESLLSWRRLASEAFEEQECDLNAFMPHLSLAYGDIDDATKRQIRADVEGAVIGCSFEVEALEVWCTQGRVEEWRQVARLPFTGS
ncbi:unnamed protein product [Phaeothamnion confervicola]